MYIYIIVISILVSNCQSNIKDNEILGNTHTHVDICEPPRKTQEYHPITQKLNIEKHELYFDELDRLKFDFVVITDHDKIDENIKEKCLNENKFYVY